MPETNFSEAHSKSLAALYKANKLLPIASHEHVRSSYCWNEDNRSEKDRRSSPFDYRITGWLLHSARIIDEIITT